MNRLVSASLNTLTDITVVSGTGNTVLNWNGSGWIGLAFNVSATLVCAGLRLRAELAKPDENVKTQVDSSEADGAQPVLLDSPATPLLAAHSSSSPLRLPLTTSLRWPI